MVSVETTRRIDAAKPPFNSQLVSAMGSQTAPRDIGCNSRANYTPRFQVTIEFWPAISVLIYGTSAFEVT